MIPANNPHSEAIGTAKAAIHPDRVALANLQPFGNDICATWHEGEGEPAVAIHETALEELRALENEGRVILLSAPRAGHGKTHLLGRVAEKLQAEAVVASLPWQTEDGMTWAGCGRGIVADLAYSGVKPNLLQRVCSGVHAALLKRLIQTGRIPSTDPSQALRVLSQDPMNLFSDSGPAKVIGEWFRKHYDQLHTTLTEVTYLEGRAEVADWLRAMFDYVEQPTAPNLATLAAGMDVAGPEQLVRFLKLVVIWKPVVLVADHMDGLYRDAEAGVAVARMALELTSLPGVRVVLSMNQDLWDTTFGRQLPSALEDRLNARNVSLAGLNAGEAIELIELRMAKVGVGERHREEFLGYLDLDRYFLGRPAGSVSTRGMLRHAAQAWRKWLRSAVAETGKSGPPGPADGDALPLIMEEVASLQAPSAMSPFLPEIEEEEEEDLSALAKHLAEDQGGEVVSLAGSPALAPTMGGDITPILPQQPIKPGNSFLPLAEPPASSSAALAAEAGSVAPSGLASASEELPAPPIASPSPPMERPPMKPAFFSPFTPDNSQHTRVPAPVSPAESAPSIAAHPPDSVSSPPPSAGTEPGSASQSGSSFAPAPAPSRDEANSTPSGASAGVGPSGGSAPTSASSSPQAESSENNFERLRQLLSKVRATAEPTVLPDAASKSPQKVRIVPASPAKEPPSKHRLMPPGGPAGVAATTAATAQPNGIGMEAKGKLPQQFSALRQQILGRDQLLKVNWPMIANVVRVAGKRFPVVTYDELELPGLGGRSLSRWRLQGAEMIFGLEDFGDERYWKTVTSFLVGRVAELTAAASQIGQPSPQIKLLVFKGDMEAAPLAGLLQQDVIPAALRTHLDVVHLDNRSLASLYAMDQILTDTETAPGGGDLHAVMTSLAGELDFFWKRITRPLR
ncbi:hypothetical protein [Verrucomicrobium spinosum]|uniref:hypothetical protein n=1 Tax=Verrucomicrobium spinosum TaxID=2736 RepID=UPI0004929129|nr:hypothetical protein [Verrucomicrobium spinosum]